jgi:DNA-binding GntR family transcriptional regulator
VQSLPPVFQSKSEYTYEVIKRQILSEELPPGSVVSQERMAADLGVSTTPLREALKRLATEGLVHLGAYRDARVTELSAEEARSLYEVRLSVDPLAASLAAQRRTDADTKAIFATLEHLHPLSGKADWDSLVAHRAFHRAVYHASHNLPLIGVLEGLWDKADRYRQVGLRTVPRSKKDIARVQAEHRALAQAVADGDAAEAEQVMRHHVGGSLGRRAMDRLEADEVERGSTAG